MWNDRFSTELMWGRVRLDPMTLAAASMTATAVGGGIKAFSTLAGGSYAEQAGNLQRDQLRMNASQEVASAQRKMFDTQERTRLLSSTSTARAAASGVDAGTGSPVENVGEIAKRGSYQALLDLFNGQSAATGDINKANAAEWEGKMKKKASYLDAAGTLAGTAGSMFKSYGKGGTT